MMMEHYDTFVRDKNLKRHYLDAFIETGAFAPKNIICSADQLTDAVRASILNAFNVNPTNFHAASESL